jgi:hypothetical protein
LLQPIFCGRDFVEDQLMSSLLESQRHFRACFTEHGGQPFGVLNGNNRIALSGTDQDTGASKVWWGGWRERDHGPQENRGFDYARAQKKNGGGNVRAVGITDRSQPSRIEFMLRRGGGNEIRQLIRAPNHIFFVENSFGQPSKKSRHTVFQNVPAQTEERGRGIEIPAERDHIVLVAARPVEKQKNAPRRTLLGRNKSMYEIHIGARTIPRSGGLKPLI